MNNLQRDGRMNKSANHTGEQERNMDANCNNPTFCYKGGQQATVAVDEDENHDVGGDANNAAIAPRVPQSASAYVRNVGAPYSSFNWIY